MIHHLSEALKIEIDHLDAEKMAAKDPKQLSFFLEILSTIIDCQKSPSVSSSESRCCDLDHSYIKVACSKRDECPCCPLGSNEARHFSPSSCCSSCSYQDCPCPISSCDCSDLTNGSSCNSCSCNCSCYPTSSSPPPLHIDEKSFQDIIKRQREGRTKNKKPLVVRHRTGRTPVRAEKSHHYCETKVKLAEPTEDVKTLMSKFKLAKEDTFALELGYRLHEALKLEEETKRIERQIDQFHRTRPSDARITANAHTNASKNSSKSARPSKFRTINPPKSRTTSPKKVFDSKRSISKSPAKTYTISQKSDELSDKRSNSLESFLGKFTTDSFPPETKKKLKIMEAKHNLMMNNLKNEMKNKESKSCLLLKGAIEAEVKKSDLLKKEIERLNNLKKRRMEEIDLLNQNVAIKEYRAEKAKVHQMVQDYHREAASKFMSVQSKQEQLIKDEIEGRLREERTEMLRMKNILKEKEAKEVQEKSKLLKAFDTMYQNKFESVKDKLKDVEEYTKIRNKNNNQLLNDIKRRLKSEFKMS